MSWLLLCCRTEDGPGCEIGDMVESQLIYSDSCNATFNQFLTSNLIVVGAVGIAFGLFEVSPFRAGLTSHSVV